ncbi:MAG: hypothetical protein H6727_03775 [Myxococcales bacterium]|nr:hypothetical protein [Myxococcales bacterium]
MEQGMLQRATERARLLEELKALLIENLHLSIQPDDIDPDAALFGSGLGLDSVDAVELIVAVEDRFDLDFSRQLPPEEAQRLLGMSSLSAQGMGEHPLNARQVETSMRIFMRTLNSLVDVIVWAREIEKISDTAKDLEQVESL